MSAYSKAIAAILGGVITIASAFGLPTEWATPEMIGVIGGVLTSTLLTLLVIPTVYEIFFDWREALRRRFGLTDGAGDEQASVTAETLLT